MSNAVYTQNESETDEEFTVREEMISSLVNQWNACDRTQERYCSAVENGEWDGEWDTEEEEKEFYAQQDRTMETLWTRKGLIEKQLQALGARLARPYEHWNEMEREMEYLENRGW
jgi:hypothetical protein